MSNLQEHIPELYKVFTEIYKARTDVVAKHFSSGDTSGWQPICDNEYTSICQKSFKSKIKCRYCSESVYTPLTEELFSQHVQGRCILGMYPLLLDHTCWFIVLDFDNHDGMKDPHKDMLRLLEVFKAHGIGSGVYRSKSGTGYHLYVHFSESVPAGKARSVMQYFIDEAGLDESSSFDAMFPKQDKLSGSMKLGNLIAMPFQGQAMQSEHTLLLDPETEYQRAYKDQLSSLKSIVRHDESDLDRIISEYIPDERDKGSNNKSIKKNDRFILPKTIPQGKRNTILLKYCSSMQAKGYSDEDIRKYMFEANETRCIPPESEDKVEQIIQHVLQYEKGTVYAGQSVQIEDEQDHDEESILICDVYKDAPVSTFARCPVMFSMDGKGIYAMQGTGKKKTWSLVLNHPVVITKRLKNISDAT